MSYVIFDIETVPDPDLWKPQPPKPRARKKDDFAPLYAHRPIVIGYALLDDNLQITAAGAIADDNEIQLIVNFSTWLASTQATLVTFNGRGFDVPVLGLRALRHGLTQTFYGPQHRRRYDEENHIDLMEALTEYGHLGRAGFSLDVLSQVIGLPGKNDFNGSMVAAAYAAGQIEKIRAHCAADCVRTAFLLVRYLLMRNRITIEQYRVAARSMYDYCAANGLSTLLFGSDPTRLLLVPTGMPEVTAPQASPETVPALAEETQPS